MLIINPGTEEQKNTTEENAIKVAENICEDLEIGKEHFRRNIKNDNNGFYGFIFEGAGGKVEVDIPGIDPEVVCLGEPWKSPRLYVAGSSWLYGYALGLDRKSTRLNSSH